jgi:hypothetical protein
MLHIRMCRSFTRKPAILSIKLSTKYGTHGFQLPQYVGEKGVRIGDRHFSFFSPHLPEFITRILEIKKGGKVPVSDFYKLL